VDRPAVKEAAVPSLVDPRVENRIATLAIARPQALNALNTGVLRELEQFFYKAAEQEDIAAVIVTGAGEKAFVAGADIAEIAACNSEQGWELSRNGQNVFSAIQRFSKPVIAAVNGYALGGGCELALACHMRIASTNAKFGLPEAGLGLIPGWGGTQRLSRLVGTGRALELILTGRTIGAGEALQMGLVNAVVEPRALMPAVLETLNAILLKGPMAVSNALEAVFTGANRPLEEALELESECFGRLFDTEDMREGCKAFLEKRKPNFQGK
jgi:enoyl-CoA hydratase